jgi:hypothetical protein
VASAYAADWSISRRLADADDRQVSVQTRTEEVEMMIPQLSAYQLWFGGGAGAAFLTEIGDSGMASATHIGVFTFWLKFGLPVFVCLVFLAYVYLPWKYIQSVIGFGVNDLNERTAFVMALPALFSWLSVLSMSGGFSRWSSVGVGLTYAAFQELRQGEEPELGGQTGGEADESLPAASRGRGPKELMTTDKRVRRFGSPGGHED